MSRSSKSKSGVDKALEAQIAQFCGVTGAPVKDAKKFLDKYKRLDLAVDAFYNDPNAAAAAARQQASAPSSSKLNALFDKYKDEDGEDITVDGTEKFCEDLGVSLEDVVLLALAYELKAPRVGEWNKKGWTDGWKSLGCDSVGPMKTTLIKLRDKLGSDSGYFKQVYNYTFSFAKAPSQRSLAIEHAIAFWQLLIPHGLQGGALSHVFSRDDEDDAMEGEEGWRDEYTQWWFDFLSEKGGKGVSKDTWVTFLDFLRSIDSKFAKYDIEAAWPSIIDDFVEWMKENHGSDLA